MAPRQTPRKLRGPSDFRAVGKIGRRTGAQLKDTGIRDEHGMEPIPSFSSPEKSAPVTNGDSHGEETTITGTYTADDSMDVANESTAPEPTDVIRSVQTRRSTYSIPRSVSPQKNLMSGKPRRSAGRPLGQLSSPTRELVSGTPSQPPVNRTLDFSAEDLPAAASLAPRRKKGRPTDASKQKKKGPFDLSVSDDEAETSINDTIDPSLIQMAPLDDDLPQIEDEPVEQENTMQSIEGTDPPLDIPEEDIDEPDTTAGSVAPPPAPKTKKGGRAPPKAPSPEPDEPEAFSSAQIPKKRGRPASKPQVEVVEEERKDEEEEEEGGGEAEEPVTQSAPTVPAKGKRKAPLTEKDPNTKLKTARKTSKAPSRAGSVQPGSTTSYMTQRSETPATDSGALTTRSGRTSLKPLAHWLGEKAILAPRTSWDTLPSIQEVVRKEVTMGPPRKRTGSYKRGGARRGRPASSLRDIEEEEAEDEQEEEGMEPWEADAGIQHAMCMQWKPEIGRYDEENTEQLEIGFAADAIEMRDIQNATFKFAKTLTLPFFGSGMVHLPPGGEKRTKNSRKMQMVFFVFFGRVTVNVGTPTTTFSIGRGGQWQVPRGNFYSIINESEKRDARLFFAQGCQWSGELEEGATMQE